MENKPSEDSLEERLNRIKNQNQINEEKEKEEKE